MSLAAEATPDAFAEEIATYREVAPTKPPKLNSTAFKTMPQERAVRDQVRAEAARFAVALDRSEGLTKPELQKFGEEMLRRANLNPEFLGFAMVCIANEFWREQVQAIDFSRRLLLLPHCLKHAEGCPADYDEFGLDCKKCGACPVADFKTKAEDLGYKVLVSEGTPIVLKIIVSGHVDAIVGVACLNVLEKAIDKILLAGIPCVAAPLLSSNCRSTSVDEDWVFRADRAEDAAAAGHHEDLRSPDAPGESDSEEPELSRLAPRPRGSVKPQATDPLATHESIAYDWMGQGGKRARPFITLAVYDALKGGAATLAADALTAIPDGVRRTALAIEAFHKASLVHDDIEDDDPFRYGRETLHRQHGIPTAINIGDYLLGFGYRLVGRDRKELGGDCTADILNKLADAHFKLSEGQGAELHWRDAHDKTLTALDALKIYALKTAPAFEAALYCGVRLAGPADAYEKAVAEFSKNLGVAFQILNDLKDWDGDGDNKLIAGQDVLSARPTLLLALALEGSTPAAREELLFLMRNAECGMRNGEHTPFENVRRLFEKAQVFVKAEKLVEKYKARAEAVADAVESTELRQLLYYLVDSVLDRQPTAEAEPAAPPLFQLSLTR